MPGASVGGVPPATFGLKCHQGEALLCMPTLLLLLLQMLHATVLGDAFAATQSVCLLWLIALAAIRT